MPRLRSISTDALVEVSDEKAGRLLGSGQWEPAEKSAPKAAGSDETTSKSTARKRAASRVK